MLAVTESVSLGVYTLFMSKDNYKELRDYGTTEVFIPLFTELELLPIYFVVYYPEAYVLYKPSGYKCRVKKPGGEEIVFTPKTKKQRLDFEYRHATRHVVYIMNPASEDSGEYKFWCSGATYYQPKQSSFTTKTEKTMKLTFITGTYFHSHGTVISACVTYVAMHSFQVQRYRFRDSRETKCCSQRK